MTKATIIRLATEEDAHGIVRLLDACFDLSGAGLAQRFTVAQVAGYVAAQPCIVAVDGPAVVGALLAQPPPAGDEAGAITRAMVDCFPVPSNGYVYGPIAVDPSARGGSLARRMVARRMAASPGATGVLFVDDRNSASLALHGAPPFQRLGCFTCHGRSFGCFALASGGSAISSLPSLQPEQAA